MGYKKKCDLKALRELVGLLGSEEELVCRQKGDAVYQERHPEISEKKSGKLFRF